MSETENNQTDQNNCNGHENPMSQVPRRTLQQLSNAMVDSYYADQRTQHIDSVYLPTRDNAIKLLDLLREIIFPGFFGARKWTSENVRFHVGQLLEDIRGLMEKELVAAIRYVDDRNCDHDMPDHYEDCEKAARHLVDIFLDRLPEIRRLLALDVQAAYDGDPAARHTDETVFAYPGIFTIFTHRIAHELYKLNAPMIPRIMSEHAHAKTGIDIHPGANIGESFFIDHGTGVVIGETSDIGNRVKIYQGVTLGALSFPKDERGRVIRGAKRHPTIEDDVTIYANAIILGGDTVIGKKAVIGGSVFLTKSVPTGYTVAIKPPELRRYVAKKSTETPDGSDTFEELEYVPDFII